MAKETKAQQAKVGRVMHAFKDGDLKSGSGQTVRNPKQAIAIALNEAGVSKTSRRRPRRSLLGV